MTAKIFNVILTLVAVIALVGCGQVSNQSASRTQKSNGTICTMIAAMAVSVYAPVASGNPDGMKVKVTLDNVVKGTYSWSSGTGEWQDTSDDSLFSFQDGKLSWAGYTEKAGKYAITVTQANGSTQTKTASVVADGCHVDGQVLNF